MDPIAFIDTEIDPYSRKILDIGSIKEDGSSFHNASLAAFIQFLEGVAYVCGHNIINHDLKYVGEVLQDTGIDSTHVIDTLYLSPLLFPAKPYHALLKDDKIQSEEVNNPLNDSKKTRDLFYDEIAAFKERDETLQEIFYLLLKDKKEFKSFFHFLSYTSVNVDIEALIRLKFRNEICEHADLSGMVAAHPIELAYSLSLIHSFNRYPQAHSITPPWVLKNYPEVERIMLRLRNRPCVGGCSYCDRALDIRKGLKRFFGYDSFRTFAGEPLQEKAIQAAVHQKSLLAVFPTGGGKSITFQLPALMSGENVRGLTIVLSPLQSLMKDQVDNLEKSGITEAVTINGLLDPIERAKAFERVEDGSASILYLSPESLRSRTIERLILGRKVVRFVIDEAHCFSAWGQDFRVDYLYIGDFIKNIQEKKNLGEPIPVSCFTATAKQKVIEDIQNYFKSKLFLELELFTSRAARTNLHYTVLEKFSEEEKYQATRDLLEEKNCPAIIYVSRTQRANSLAGRLTADGFKAKPYHGKMDVQEKTANQNAFIAGEVSIMVATSAFGMGVDKKDIGMVIHYDISDSLENYVQEAGRAGRDEKIQAECYVLFNEEDLSKHFILLNQTKLSIKEIQQVWKAIKEISKFRSTVSSSALEIARKAGWDDSVAEIETRVTTALAALEDAGYVKRGQNMPRIFANSILARNAQEAIDKIEGSVKFEEKQKEKGIRIIRKLFSSKSRKQANGETGESRVDYLSDHLGIVKEEVIDIINLLREENILADAKDLTAFIKKGENKNHSLQVVRVFKAVEIFVLSLLEEQEKVLSLKEVNEEAEANGCEGVNINRIKTVFNFWAIKNWIKRKNLEYSKNHVAAICLQPKKLLEEKLEKRHELAIFIIEFLYEKSNSDSLKEVVGKEEVLVEFSVLELKDAYENAIMSFGKKVSLQEVEDALFYLSRIEAIKIEGGFLVIYNRLTIERLEQDNKRRYKIEDYQKLRQFYENKIQQIHIVGEYARKMISDYRGALQFVEDYFHLNYAVFLNKYFKGSRQEEIKRNITPAKFKELFGELSPTQLKIIKDQETKYIVVAAGPGSGKTRVLVHKLASLLLMEDVKHEQLLMLTFSRSAATEFKKRLLKLIGNAANYVDIKTFHAYCFDILGKVGSLEKSDQIIVKAIERIKNKEVEASRITKTVLVIDEAQDMDRDEFGLITTLMEQNEDMRVIAVGDDDQNIYEFRGADNRYLEQFILKHGALKYELVENYRSKRNLVEFTNQFVTSIRRRLKHTPIVARQADNGMIRIVHYESDKLIVPLVEDVLAAELSGTACVLTKTNEEALQVTGLLSRNGVKAKLIQTNDGFNLYNLAEIRFFLDQLCLTDDVFVISDEVWEKAKRQLKNRFYRSSKWEICNHMLRDFELTNPHKKYKSDLEVFIRESRLEDFFNEEKEAIVVSTIHKAKGKEFDHVFLLLDRFNVGSDDARRQLYVAMTRAKRNLSIHLNSCFLDSLSAENLERIEDNHPYSLPDEIMMQLTHREVWLNNFSTSQKLIAEMKSGDVLAVTSDRSLAWKGRDVLKFSRKFMEQIVNLQEKGYELKEAKVNYILYWYQEDQGREIKIILPELYFKKEKRSFEF